MLRRMKTIWIDGKVRSLLHVDHWLMVSEGHKCNVHPHHLRQKSLQMKTSYMYSLYVHVSFLINLTKDHFLFQCYFLKLNIELKLMSSEAMRADKVIILVLPGGAACPQ